MKHLILCIGIAIGLAAAPALVVATTYDVNWVHTWDSGPCGVIEGVEGCAWANKKYEPWPTFRKCGDMNGDNRVTATDSLAVLRIANGLDDPPRGCSCEQKPGD